MSTREALAMNRTHTPLNDHRCATARLRGACWLLILALALVLAGCSEQHAEQADPDSIPQRAPGVSVAEHWGALLEIEDTLVRSAAMAQFMTTLGPEDADAIGEIVSTRFRRHRSIDDLILWNAWSRFDPAAAATRAAVVVTPMAEGLRVDVILEWASQDPHAAVATMGSAEPAIRRAMVRGWYQSGVPGLSDYILSADSGRLGQSLLAAYAVELGADKGASGIAEWLDSTRGRSDVERIMITNAHRKGIMEMAMVDPDAAIAYCELHCDGPYGDMMRPRLAERFGMIGLGGRAVLWLEGEVDANQVDRGRGARFAYRAWLKDDREAALDWANESFEKYKDEEWFLPLARIVVTLYTVKDPETALVWIDVFKEPQDREDALIQVARRWLKLDKKAAEAWLETSSLDSEAKAKARTTAKRRGVPQ